MLRPAMLYKDKLNRLMIEIVHDEEYKYYMGNTTNFRNMDFESENTIYYISILPGDDTSEDKILGLISYTVGKEVYQVRSFGAISFNKKNKNIKNDVIFGKDINQVIDDIFCKFKYNRLEFVMIVGNPIESTYDKLVKSHGGRVAGHFRKSVKLWDGETYDEKYYEILRDEYLSSKKK